MVDAMKACASPVPLSLVALLSLAAPARTAPTAEVAKMCREQAIKAHPTKPAGSRSGYEQAQRDYFRDCVEKNSKKQN
jgi:hypothetical protein